MTDHSTSDSAAQSGSLIRRDQLLVTRYLRASTEAAAKLTSRLDLQQVSDTVVDTLVAGFDAALARIWLYDAADNALYLRASAGLFTETEASSQSRIAVATYPYAVGDVARERMPFIKNGLAGDPRFEQDWVAREHIASAAIFPLLIEDELLGVVAYFSRLPLPAAIVEVLTAFTAMVTTAVNDVQLFVREQTSRAEAERAEERFAYLAEASSVLASSLDYQTTLANVAQLTVPRLADWCVIHIVEEDGSVRELDVAHADPAKVVLAHELQHRYPFDPDAPSGAANVLRTAVSEIVPEITDEMLVAAVPDAELLQILRELGLKSSMVVPLVARGRTLGAITFVWAESNRRYSEADLALAESLGRRAATAVDNARLYHEVQEAIRTRDEFVSSISHDLKNPLTALIAQAQMLQRRAASMGGDEGEQMLRGLENVVASASRIDRLINDLLDLAQVRMGRPLDLNRQPLDLVELVRQMATEQQQLSEEHAIRIKTAIPTLPGSWDRARLERVFGNLLSNSVKYSPDGGTITLSIWREDGGAGSFAVVAVRDRGLGIPDRDLAHIFERFQRGSNVMDRISGSGIGLAGARQIVEQHGGTISVQSREGEGSTFTVRLPLN